MTIKDLMTTDVDLINPMTTVAEASRIMRDDDVGVIPVAEDDQLVGMVTDRDIVIRTVAGDRDPATTNVRQAMTENVLYCFDDQTAEEVAANMGEEKIRRLPVLNREKRLVGIVSLGDLSASATGHPAGEALSHIAGADQ